MQLAPGKTRTKLLRTHKLLSLHLFNLSASLLQSSLQDNFLCSSGFTQNKLPPTSQLTSQRLNCTRKLNLSRIRNILFLLKWYLKKIANRFFWFKKSSVKSLSNLIPLATTQFSFSKATNDTSLFHLLPEIIYIYVIKYVYLYRQSPIPIFVH